MKTLNPAPICERSWANDRIAAARYFRYVEGTFRDELALIGCGEIGHNHPADLLVRAALAGNCHCGHCSPRYARCTFTSPRHIGDVFANLYATGSKAAAYVAQAASRVNDWPEFDGVLSLGCGAGACLTGLAIANRLPGQRFGVEIEPHARRLLPHIVPDVRVDDDIDNLHLPSGNLLVVASLVWNLPVPSYSWAAAIARDRSEFTTISVTRPWDRVNRHPAETWRQLGFTPTWPYEWRDTKNQDPAWRLSGDSSGYGIEVDHWRRA